MSFPKNISAHSNDAALIELVQAREPAGLPVDMFVASGDAPILAAMRASDTISIVMTLAAIRSAAAPIHAAGGEKREFMVAGLTIRAW